jgi:uncharacterized membrane protein
LLIYIFLCTFFNAMLAASVVVLALIVLFIATDTYSFHRISSDYLPSVPLYLFPEGLLSDMTITALTGSDGRLTEGLRR